MANPAGHAGGGSQVTIFVCIERTCGSFLQVIYLPRESGQAIATTGGTASRSVPSTGAGKVHREAQRGHEGTGLTPVRQR